MENKPKAFPKRYHGHSIKPPNTTVTPNKFRLKNKAFTTNNHSGVTMNHPTLS